MGNLWRKSDSSEISGEIPRAILSKSREHFFAKVRGGISGKISERIPSEIPEENARELEKLLKKFLEKFLWNLWENLWRNHGEISERIPGKFPGTFKKNNPEEIFVGISLYIPVRIFEEIPQLFS